MIPILTTITPYWGRPEQLKHWLWAIAGATTPRVRHLVYMVGEASLPLQVDFPNIPTNVEIINAGPQMGHSIGYYHNMGADRAETDWIMKLDIDALPNVRYFSELVPILELSIGREWFNGGMFYLNQVMSAALFGKGMPLTENSYLSIMRNRHHWSANLYFDPASTNFICCRRTYLKLGGCSNLFKGWGWEDYQQTFMLEKYQQGDNPLKGELTLDNVTHRCKVEITRRKATELWEKNPWLCLIHRFHPPSTDKAYRSHSQNNRQVLFDYIKKSNQVPAYAT